MRTNVKNLFSAFDVFGRLWLALGLGSLAAAAAMSFDFGWGVSTKHAVFLAILTVVAAFGPMAAEVLWRRGRKGPAIACAVICVPLLGIEYYSHAGYTAGLRGSNIETAHVQNTRFNGAQDAVSDDKANVALWRKQLAALMEANSWAGTVKADGLRAQIEDLRKAEASESQLGGCKQKCRAIQNQITEAQGRIAVAEQSSDLTKRIEATQRILDGKREVAGKTEHKSSAVDHQNKFLKQSVALFVNGSTEASELQGSAVEQAVNHAMALAGTGVPAFALFMAGLFLIGRRDGHHDKPDHQSGTSYPVSELGNRNPEPRAYSQPLVNVRSLADVMADMRMIQARAA